MRWPLSLLRLSMRNMAVPYRSLKATQDYCIIMIEEVFDEPSLSPQSDIRILPCPGRLWR